MDEIIKEIKAQYELLLHPDSIEVKKVTKELLDEMLEVCNNTKHMEEKIAYYGTYCGEEEDPNECIYLNIEGEGYGWVWDTELDESKWHGLLKNLLEVYVSEKAKKIENSDECAIVVKRERETIYRFIERNLKEKRDVIYTFSQMIMQYLEHMNFK